MGRAGSAKRSLPAILPVGIFCFCLFWSLPSRHYYHLLSFWVTDYGLYILTHKTPSPLFVSGVCGNIHGDNFAALLAVLFVPSDLQTFGLGMSAGLFGFFCTFHKSTSSADCFSRDWLPNTYRMCWRMSARKTLMRQDKQERLPYSPEGVWGAGLEGIYRVAKVGLCLICKARHHALFSDI